MLRSTLLLVCCFCVTPHAIAQNPENSSTPAATPAQILPVGITVTELRIRKAMQLPITQKFEETRLDEALKTLADLGKIDLHIDLDALEEDGIPPDEPVSGSFKQISLQNALEELLEALNLTWFLQEGAVHVTTLVSEYDTMFTRTYDVKEILEVENQQSTNKRFDFQGPMSSTSSLGAARRQFGSGLGGGGFGQLQPGPQSSATQTEEQWLVDAVQNVTNGPWANFDGEGGTVILLKTSLIIRARYQLQLEVESFLTALLTMQRKPPGTEIILARYTGYPLQQDHLIEQILNQPWQVEIQKQPLNEVLDELSRKFQIPVKIDRLGFAEEGLQPDEPVTAVSKMQTIRGVLDVMLRPYQAVAIVRHGKLIITTVTSAEAAQFSMLYDLRRLVVIDEDHEELKEALMKGTNYWSQLDGPATNLAFTPSGILIVKQFYGEHQKLKSLISSLQKTLERKPVTKTEAADPHESSLQYYSFADSKTSKELGEVLQEFVQPKSWKVNGGEGILRQVNNTLLIKQPIKIHKELNSWLTDYYARTVAPASTFPFGGGGFGNSSEQSDGTKQPGSGFFQLDNTKSSLAP